jgi:serine phosphatase RsbU (regulator of sigma subunit)
MGIAARFALAVGGGLAVMLIIYALVVLRSAGTALEKQINALGVQASRALAAAGRDGWLVKGNDNRWRGRKGSRTGIKRIVENNPYVLNAYVQDAKDHVLVTHFKAEGFTSSGTGFDSGVTKVFFGTYKSGGFAGRVRLYRTPLLTAQRQSAGWANVLVSETVIEEELSSLRKTIFLLSLLAIGVAVGVAFWVSGMVTSPLRALVQAVSRINRGNLSYRSTVRSKGEVGALSKAIEQMCESLREGEHIWEELDQVREQGKLVGELQTALLPQSVPEVEGFEVDSTHVAGAGGTAGFWDAVPLPDGRLALVVAATSGQGALGALLAAMTRAYVRGYLEETGDAGKSLRAANRNLAQGMRKGLHVTCQVAVLDPRGQRATVYVAGHRAPFYACRGGEVSVVHGEGLALGLDKGKVFDRRLEEVVVEMPPGTRIVMTTVGTYDFEGEDGTHYGIDRFQDLVRKHAPKNSDAFVNLVVGALEMHQGEADRVVDATLVTAKRMV